MDSLQELRKKFVERGKEIRKFHKIQAYIRELYRGGIPYHRFEELCTSLNDELESLERDLAKSARLDDFVLPPEEMFYNPLHFGPAPLRPLELDPLPPLDDFEITSLQPDDLLASEPSAQELRNLRKSIDKFCRSLSKRRIHKRTQLDTPKRKKGER